ncbi:MAG: hypothetical protein A2Y17_08900 [Clostridiales bacterium GWF2_38_85]|nr:MAG: hypothetical protein A2Y17_08900 [Clostridiales bacterium GWF2_38_85]HBL83686.1 hypothetical protein [Clostridiales bacterium]
MAAANTSYNYSAVFAKCRAKSATLLKFEDYHAMAAMKNVSEVASYLDQNSDYADVLQDANIIEIHRAELEALLYENLFKTYKSLYIFTNGELREFIGAMMRKYNIDVILRIARNLTSSVDEKRSDDNDRVIITVAHTELNMPKISAAQNLEQLGEALAGTRYYKSYKNSFISGKLNYGILEVNLYNEYYNLIYTKFVEKKNTTSAKSIQKLLYLMTDLINLTTIMRLKISFNAKADKIIPYLLSIRSGRNKREYIVLSNMSNEDFMEYLRKTAYNKQVSIDARISTSDYINNYLYIYYRKLMISATPSFEHPFAYLSLKEIEIKNLIHIIEGVRYNITEEKIMDKIIIKH